ncbi:MAG: nuclear transport factor 2 family protein [Nevskiaceae bacterium]|nr:nuclear transport factor 2 family protein [Nevskiaceae bacterium]
MKTRLIWSLAATVLLATMSATAVQAQEPVVGVADPEALFTDKDPKLHRNKQAAYHIVKDLLEANQWQNANQWLTDRYLQHNPQAASGLAGVVKFFTEVMKRQPSPVPEKMKTKVVAVVADGDYVIVVFPREYPRPDDPSKTYSTTWFDMWRFVDGKADEHWDPATLPPVAAK